MMTLFTLVIAVFTILVFLVYERMEWLTGAMETHSNMMLRIEALRGVDGDAIEMRWWDPSEGDPPVDIKHDEPIKLDCIYLYLPPKLRRNQPSILERFTRLF